MMRPFGVWNRTPLAADLALVAVVVAALLLWSLWFDGSNRMDQVLNGIRVPIYRTTITVAASLLGFSLMVISVVMGFSTHERLTLLRESKHYPTLWRTFFGAVRALALLLVCAFLGLVFDRDDNPVVGVEVAYLSLCLLAALRLHRSVWILRQLVNLIAKPSQ